MERIVAASGAIFLACLCLLFAGMTAHPSLRILLLLVTVGALAELVRVLWHWEQ